MDPREQQLKQDVTDLMSGKKKADWIAPADKREVSAATAMIRKTLMVDQSDTLVESFKTSRDPARLVGTLTADAITGLEKKMKAAGQEVDPNILRLVGKQVLQDLSKLGHQAGGVKVDGQEAASKFMVIASMHAKDRRNKVTGRDGNTRAHRVQNRARKAGPGAPVQPEGSQPFLPPGMNEQQAQDILAGRAQGPGPAPQPQGPTSMGGIVDVAKDTTMENLQQSRQAGGGFLTR